MKRWITKTTLAPLALIIASMHSNAEEVVTLKTTKVRDNIYMIEGANGFAGGNVAASIGKDGILVIDSLIGSQTDALTTSLAQLSSNNIRYLLNTHWHGDHTGGNGKLGTKTPIIAHDNVRKRMMQDQENYFGKSPASPHTAWPVLTFSETMTVYFNQDTVQLKHYPTGHTDGDSMVYFVKANVLHMGDDYFKDVFPFIDLSTGGSVVGLEHSVAKVLKEMPKDVLIIPGHGALANLEDLGRFHQMLIASLDIVKQGIKEGLSLAAIQSKGLGKTWTSWGAGFIPEKDWIDMTFQSLMTKLDDHDHPHQHDGQPQHHH